MVIGAVHTAPTCPNTNVWSQSFFQRSVYFQVQIWTLWSREQFLSTAENRMPAEPHHINYTTTTIADRAYDE
jgi:hypothetical protein